MMKSVLLAGGLSLFLLGGSACHSSKNTSKSMSHNSRTALDWPGTYSGMLPCGDCSGIKTTVELRGNLSYSISTVHVGKSKETARQEGSFIWSEDGSSITLNRASNSEAAARFKVFENGLVSLDAKGQAITGKDAEKYILTKQPAVITEKYWKLVSLAGKAVAPPEEGRKEAYFILKTNGENKVLGNTGCNTMFGTYKLSDGNRIDFGDIGATRMACMGENPEAGFLKALGAAHSYTVDGEDTLFLNNDKKVPLAKFAAIYF